MSWDKRPRWCRDNTKRGLTIKPPQEGSMAMTLLAPSVRLANEAIAKRIVAKVRDHSPPPGLLARDRWELAEAEIRLALDAASGHHRS
jgi:hypothetical protein